METATRKPSRTETHYSRIANTIRVAFYRIGTGGYRKLGRIQLHRGERRAVDLLWINTAHRGYTKGLPMTRGDIREHTFATSDDLSVLRTYPSYTLVSPSRCGQRSWAVWHDGERYRVTQSNHIREYSELPIVRAESVE